MFQCFPIVPSFPMDFPQPLFGHVQVAGLWPLAGLRDDLRLTWYVLNQNMSNTNDVGGKEFMKLQKVLS